MDPSPSSSSDDDNEVISVHTTSSSDFDEDEDVDSDMDTLMGSSSPMMLTASSQVLLRTQPSDASAKKQQQETATEPFKLTKAPTAKPKRRASQSPKPAGKNNSSKKQKKQQQQPSPTTTTTTKTRKENDRPPNKAPALETDNPPPRRVRRTPLEGAEAIERRVQEELAAARDRLAAQKTKSTKEDPPAPKKNIAAQTAEDCAATKQLEYTETKPSITSSSSAIPTNRSKEAAASSKVAAKSEIASNKDISNKVPAKPDAASKNAKAKDSVPVESANPKAQPKNKESTKTVDKAKATSLTTTVAPTKTTTNEKPASATAVSAPVTKTSNPTTTNKVAVSSSTSSATKQPPKKKKMTFDEQVLSHMRMAFKPFSLKTLAHELASTETIVNFSMLTMVDKGLVVKKDFPSKGGNKDKTLYWANHGVSTKELSAPQVATEDEIQVTKHELENVRKQNAVIHHNLQVVLETPSNYDLTQQVANEQAQLDELTKQLDDMNERIRSTFGSGPPAKKPTLLGRNLPEKSAAELARERCPRRMKIRINNMRGEWKTRKDKCADFCNELADCLEKKPKDVIKLLDLETDEMVGVTLPPKHVVEDRR